MSLQRLLRCQQDHIVGLFVRHSWESKLGGGRAVLATILEMEGRRNEHSKETPHTFCVIAATEIREIGRARLKGGPKRSSRLADYQTRYIHMTGQASIFKLGSEVVRVDSVVE